MLVAALLLALRWPGFPQVLDYTDWTNPFGGLCNVLGDFCA
jgi:hypothetical protein